MARRRPREARVWRMAWQFRCGFVDRWQVHHRSEEHTSELQSRLNLVCRLLLEKKKNEHKCTLPQPDTDPLASLLDPAVNLVRTFATGCEYRMVHPMSPGQRSITTCHTTCTSA